ncbi:MAG TPA: VTT domain-containing protein [Pyrinomonadaceae bacterium]|nr:VTT domain-containing protein [Pyrinomonadaceae bacterium]
MNSELELMKRYLLTVVVLIACFTILFLIVEALGVPLLSDPTPWMRHGGVLAAFVGVGLLIADVVLPVPSSIVMVAHGALFGVLWGTMLSLLGSTGAAVFGFVIGRRGGALLERVVTPAERARASSILGRWGTLAIIVTRPVPLLAETVAIMAGASSMNWRAMIVASLAGSLPPALLYALTGAAVANLQNTVLMFGIVLLIAGLFWVAGVVFSHKEARKVQS